MTQTILPVALEKAYRLLNHGPTVLVSGRHDGVDDVMAAAWSCALDFSPPKLTVVLDRATRTRQLIEQSGRLVIQVPTAAQLELTYAVGSHTMMTEPDKLQRHHVPVVEFDGQNLPFVAGCSAWLACRVIPEPHIEQTYDLFIAQVEAAWADARVFRNGHWEFEQADPGLRSLHYIAGGHFYAIGQAMSAQVAEPRPQED